MSQRIGMLSVEIFFQNHTCFIWANFIRIILIIEIYTFVCYYTKHPKIPHTSRPRVPSYRLEIEIGVLNAIGICNPLGMQNPRCDQSALIRWNRGKSQLFLRVNYCKHYLHGVQSVHCIVATVFWTLRYPLPHKVHAGPESIVCLSNEI